MPIKDDRYTYRVTWSDEDEEYVGLCAELPSLSWLAGTPEGALRVVRRVVAEAVEDMARHGETVPEPLALRKYSGKFVVRVPPDVHRRLVLDAAETEVSLNRVAAAKLGR